MAAPVEPISLSIGAVALASLFTTCLDCLDMIDAGRNFSRDLEIALAKLEAQRAIFLVWGNTVGLDNSGKNFNKQLLGPGLQKTIQRLLCCIVSLFEDSKKFRKRYGLKKATALDVACVSEYASTGLEGYRSRLRLFQKQSSFTTKVRWAVHDKNKFTALIVDLKDLIDQLRDVTSSVADFERQRQLLAAEISSLSDSHSLEVLEEALREDDPEMSEVASQRIVQLTEGGTNAQYLLLESESQYVTAYSGVQWHDICDDVSLCEPRGEPDMAVSDKETQESEEATLPPLDSLDQVGEMRSDLVYGQQNNLKAIHEQNKARFEKVCANVNTGAIRERAVKHHIKELLYQPDGLVTLGPESDNFAALLAAVQGPSDTPYEGGVFFIRMRIPRDFPLAPPVCHMLTPVLHPNIASDGKIVIDVLTIWQGDGLDHWSPIWTLGKLLQAFLSILCDPDWFNAASPEISHWYGESPWAFEAQSRILTQRFAQQTKPMERPYADAYFEILRQLGIQHPSNDRRLLEAENHDQKLPQMEPREGRSPLADEDETYMPLFIAIIMWFAFCIALHFLLVEPSFT